MKTLKYLIFLILFYNISVLSAQNEILDKFPQNTFKKWQGEIDLKTQGKLKIFVEFLNEKTAKMSIPQQGAKNIALQNVYFVAPDSVFFSLGASIGIAVFKGKHTKNLETQQIIGSFKQNGNTFSFSIFPQKVLSPTQLENQPFTEREVSWYNDEAQIKLAGTLAFPKKLPKNGDKYPVVILVSGSGAQTRDCEINDFAMFKIISDYLTTKGIVVLRYDERGTGESKGKNVMFSTTEELAQDVESIVKFLSNYPNIDTKKISILGHSEGGIIAPMVAQKLPNLVHSIILVGGTAVSGFEILREQKALIARVNKVSEKEIKEEDRLFKIMFEALNNPEKTTKLFNILQEEAKKGGMNDQKSKEYAQNAIQSISLPWIKFFMKYDPALTLSKLQCPVFAIFAEKDLQVSPKQNLPAMKKALKNNKSAKFYTFKNANHLFQFSKTGNPQEYTTAKPEFIPEFLPKIAEWLTKIYE